MVSCMENNAIGIAYCNSLRSISSEPTTNCLIYIDSFASMVRKSDRPRITFCTHHRQGISLPTYRKPRIDFEKTCGMDLFCKGVPKIADSHLAICYFCWVRGGSKPTSELCSEIGSEPFSSLLQRASLLTNAIVATFVKVYIPRIRSPSFAFNFFNFA